MAAFFFAMRITSLQSFKVAGRGGTPSPAAAHRGARGTRYFFFFLAAFFFVATENHLLPSDGASRPAEARAATRWPRSEADRVLSQLGGLLPAASLVVV